MTEQEILAAVQEIFRDNFDDDSLVITRDTCADDIEDWDSLEQINLLTAIEKKFNIKFKLADVRGLNDVGDLLDLVRQSLCDIQRLIATGFFMLGAFGNKGHNASSPTRDDASIVNYMRNISYTRKFCCIHLRLLI